MSAPEPPAYSAKEVARILDLQESRVRYWAQTGFVGPSGRHDGKPVYTFADLVQLKAAKELVERGLPVQRVRKSLDALRKLAPDLERPLSRLRVASDGDAVVVTEDGSFEALSGQALFEFDVDALGARAAEIVRLSAAAESAARPRHLAAVPSKDGARSAYAWFREGLRHEDRGENVEAEAAYERALGLDGRLAAAHTNLGNLRFSAGRHDEARASYARALALDPEQPEAIFNSAYLHERMGEQDVALALYRRATRLSPDFADGHLRLALLLDEGGQRDDAREHFRRFLELCKGERSKYVELARSRVEV
jgi:tetratricopeptide (TPR) repeat protein